jgi:sulfate transport system permease protein
MNGDAPNDSALRTALDEVVAPLVAIDNGKVTFVRGALPGETEVTSQWIRTLIENDDRTGAAAVSVVLLALSFLVLLVLRTIGSRAAKREELAP